MNEIIINNTSLGIKEYNGQRVITFKDIDEVHKRPEGTARRNFNTNKAYFIEGEDYFVRNSYEAKTEFGITAPNGLVLITESGYYMLVKSFTDDLSWAVQRELTNCYFRVQQIQQKQLSPIEMIAGIANNAVAMERRLAEHEKAIAGTNQRIDDMCEIMKPVSDDWRPAMNKLVKRIADVAEYPIDELWIDIYDEVDIRGGVHLATRLDNLRDRLKERGYGKSTIYRTNKLDVIQQDKKLIAIYVAVVKDFATKYIG